MLNLKGPYDVVVAAETAWKQKAAEIASLLEQGTNEATEQALALQGSLETLQADYQEKKALYDKLVAANAPSDVAKLFVPASPTSPEGDDKPKGVMTRKEFFALTPAAQKKFALTGGKVTDE
jgi:hypothetical protein